MDYHPSTWKKSEGAWHPCSRKLTTEDAMLIKALIAENKAMKEQSKELLRKAEQLRKQAKRVREEMLKVSHAEIAAKFDVSVGTIDRIAGGKHWRNA